MALSPKLQVGNAQGTASVLANITWGDTIEKSSAERSATIAHGFFEISQECLTETYSDVEHQCTAQGSKVCCDPMPRRLEPASLFVKNGNCWTISLSALAQKECFDILIVSSKQEKFKMCWTGATWQSLNLEVNSTWIAPPSTVKWPDLPQLVKTCSLLEIRDCSLVNKLMYIFIWLSVAAGLGYLVYRLIMCILARKGKCAKKHTVNHSPSADVNKHSVTREEYLESLLI